MGLCFFLHSFYKYFVPGGTAFKVQILLSFISPIGMEFMAQAHIGFFIFPVEFGFVP